MSVTQKCDSPYLTTRVTTAATGMSQLDACSAILTFATRSLLREMNNRTDKLSSRVDMSWPVIFSTLPKNRQIRNDWESYYQRLVSLQTELRILLHLQIRAFMDSRDVQELGHEDVYSRIASSNLSHDAATMLLASDFSAYINTTERNKALWCQATALFASIAKPFIALSAMVVAQLSDMSPSDFSGNAHLFSSECSLDADTLMCIVSSTSDSPNDIQCRIDSMPEMAGASNHAESNWNLKTRVTPHSVQLHTLRCQTHTSIVPNSSHMDVCNLLQTCKSAHGNATLRNTLPRLVVFTKNDIPYVSICTGPDGGGQSRDLLQHADPMYLPPCDETDKTTIMSSVTTTRGFWLEIGFATKSHDTYTTCRHTPIMLCATLCYANSLEQVPVDIARIEVDKAHSLQFDLHKALLLQKHVLMTKNTFRFEGGQVRLLLRLHTGKLYNRCSNTLRNGVCVRFAPIGFLQGHRSQFLADSAVFTITKQWKPKCNAEGHSHQRVEKWRDGATHRLPLLHRVLASEPHKRSATEETCQSVTRPKDKKRLCRLSSRNIVDEFA